MIRLSTGRKGVIRVSVLLSFRLGADLFLIPLENVERIVQIAALRSVPGAPPELMGILTVHGEAVPALDIRRRLGIVAPAPDLTHQLILLRSGAHRAALLVDEALEVITLEHWQSAAELMLPAFAGTLPWVAGAVQLEGRSRVLLDVQALFSFLPAVPAALR